jgi:hypothetical protein
MNPTVYVYHDRCGRHLPCALPLKVCRTEVEAQTLARAIRDVFRCPTWVEDFDRPANTKTIAIRQNA